MNKALTCDLSFPGYCGSPHISDVTKPQVYRPPIQPH